MNIVKLSPEYFPNPSISRALGIADIYVGIPDLDPEVVANQKTLSVQQEDGTIVAVTQPISTGSGGVPLYEGSPVTLLVEGDYSLKVLDSSGDQIYYVPSTAYEKYLVTGNYYYPDYTETDQGVVGSGNSVTDIMATVGAVTKATMYFANDSGEATTTYTFSTDTTITDNFNVIIEKGAILTISTAKTLTINGSFGTSELYQTFLCNGTGSVVFGPGSITEINPEVWGENTTPGTTDMTAEIQAALDSGINNIEGIIGSVYLISDTLNVPTSVRLANINLKAAANFGNNPLISNKTVAPASDAARDANIILENLYLNGNKAANTTGTEFSHGISLTGVADTVIKKVHILNPKGDGIYIGANGAILSENISIESATVDGAARQGIATVGVEDFNINNIEIRNGSHHGIDLEVAGGYVTKNVNISNFVIHDNGSSVIDRGINVIYGTGTNENIAVSNGSIVDQTGVGIGFRGTTGLTINNVIIDTPTSYGLVHIGDTAGSGTNISNVDIISPGNTGVSLGVDADYTLTNVTVSDGSAGGFVISSCADAVLTSLKADGCAGDGLVLNNVTMSSIVGGSFSNNTGAGSDGIQLSGASQYNSFVGITASGNVGRGIYEIDTSNYNMFSGNNIYNNTAGGITTLTTGSKYENNKCDVTLDVASATTTTLPVHSNFFNITGTTNITTLTASWAERVVVLKFAGILDFTDGNNIKIASTMTTSADDTITIVSDGTNWYEMSRSTN